MGVDCSSPSRSTEVFYLPSDSLRSCTGSPCWCQSSHSHSHHRHGSRRNYMYFENGGHGHSYDPFRYLLPLMMGGGMMPPPMMMGGGGNPADGPMFGGRGFGGWAGLGWKDPREWTTRDYDRLGEIMSEYTSRMRGRGGWDGGGFCGGGGMGGNVVAPWCAPPAMGGGGGVGNTQMIIPPWLFNPPGGGGGGGVGGGMMPWIGGNHGGGGANNVGMLAMQQMMTALAQAQQQQQQQPQDANGWQQMMPEMMMQMFANAGRDVGAGGRNKGSWIDEMMERMDKMEQMAKLYEDKVNVVHNLMLGSEVERHEEAYRQRFMKHLNDCLAGSQAGGGAAGLNGLAAGGLAAGAAGLGGANGLQAMMGNNAAAAHPLLAAQMMQNAYGANMMGGMNGMAGMNGMMNPMMMQNDMMGMGGMGGMGGGNFLRADRGGRSRGRRGGARDFDDEDEDFGSRRRGGRFRSRRRGGGGAGWDDEDDLFGGGRFDGRRRGPRGEGPGGGGPRRRPPSDRGDGPGPGFFGGGGGGGGAAAVRQESPPPLQDMRSPLQRAEDIFERKSQRAANVAAAGAAPIPQRPPVIPRPAAVSTQSESPAVRQSSSHPPPFPRPTAMRPDITGATEAGLHAEATLTAEARAATEAAAPTTEPRPPPLGDASPPSDPDLLAAHNLPHHPTPHRDPTSLFETRYNPSIGTDIRATDRPNPNWTFAPGVEPPAYLSGTGISVPEASRYYSGVLGISGGRTTRTATGIGGAASAGLEGRSVRFQGEGGRRLTHSRSQEKIRGEVPKGAREDDEEA